MVAGATTSPRTVIRDSALMAGAVVAAGVAVVVAADLGGRFAQASARLLFVIPALAVLSVLASRIAGRLRRGDPAWRFWRIFSVSALCWAAVNVDEAIRLLRRPGDPLPLGHDPVDRVLLFASTASMAMVLLEYPLPRRSERERLFLCFDGVTVLIAVGAYTLYTLPDAIPSPPASPLLAALVTVFPGPLMAMVAMLAVIRLVNGGGAPFTRVSGALAVVGVGAQSVAQGPTVPPLAIGNPSWLWTVNVIGVAALTASARVQLNLASGTAPVPDGRSRRPYSLLPYFAIAATYGLLVTSLARSGLGGRSWLVLAGAICSTGVVVGRQVVSLKDNERLLDERDSKVEALNRAEGVLRAALEERDALAERLRQLAFHDQLTGLANRALFTERLEDQLVKARREGSRFAVVLVDLDDFKPVNDAYGHEAGDLVLRRVAERLRSCVRGAETVARVGGDEFAIVLDRRRTPAAVCGVADRILHEVTQPHRLGDDLVRVGASVGVAYSRGEVGAAEMMRHADMAMYAAKCGGKNAYRVFQPDGQPATKVA